MLEFKSFRVRIAPLCFACLALFLAGCETIGNASTEALPEAGNYDYVIGPGDTLDIFVWRNPEVSVQAIPVRPDGKISVPLVEDLVASGKTSNQLARDIEQVLSQYVKEPAVTVTIVSFQGGYQEQIRVVGQAATPQALRYSAGMTVLDVMIAVGGLAEFAAGNRTRLVRNVGGKQQQTLVRLDDLLKNGDISANVPMRPGDIVIIPESWF